MSHFVIYKVVVLRQKGEYLYRSRIFKFLRSPGIDSKDRFRQPLSFADRYDNPVSTRFLATIVCSKIPAQKWILQLFHLYDKTLRPWNCTAKTKCRKFKTNIPRKGISGPRSQFPHSCVCETIIYSHDGSACSAGGNMWTDPGNI